jgi:hypothetical protein
MTHRSARALIAACAALALGASGCRHELHPEFEPPVVCRTAPPVTASVFLIGDAGAPELPDPPSAAPEALVDPLLGSLARDVAASVDTIGAERTAVVVLGDNVYPAGMPPPGEEGHEHAVRVLEAQIAAIGSARGFFTLGNHDWDQGQEHGFARARTQHDYLSTRASNISLHPPDACPGPEEVRFGDQLQLIFFDLWAAIHQVDHPQGPQAHCPTHAGEGRLVEAVDRMLAGAGSRRSILVTHAPMYTTGPHGGYFPWREHVFPLRVFDRDWWIPLPIVGSLFPLARRLGVTDTDQMGARYREYIDRAKSIFAPGRPTLVAAGHEHSLQIHIDPTGVFHAVSGAGSVDKVDYVGEMKTDLMSLAAPGYMRLDAYQDGKLRLNVIALDDDHDARLVFSTCIP